jgi:hypothetical protein
MRMDSRVRVVVEEEHLLLYCCRPGWHLHQAVTEGFPWPVQAAPEAVMRSSHHQSNLLGSSDGNHRRDNFVPLIYWGAQVENIAGILCAALALSVQPELEQKRHYNA